MANLLAHLYPFIKGSQEDIATLSLQFLLAQSDHLNREFTKMVASKMQVELPSSLQYICQVTGSSEEKERPDMAGIDSEGKEVILCEMKFYASLTPNQPSTYLRRLKENNGAGLMFVCPAARRTSLWSKLQELCAECEVEEVGEFCISVDGVRLAISTWTEIIEHLKQVAAALDIKHIADIEQFEGYCKQMDSDAFVPYTAEDLSAEQAKREERHYQVVDEVMELLLADGRHKTSKDKLKATAYRKGYTRSLYIDEYTVTFNYDRDLWKNPATVETPFWIGVRNAKWEQTEDICEALNRISEQRKEHFWNMIFVAAEPLQNATLSEVCEDLKQQILRLIAAL